MGMDARSKAWVGVGLAAALPLVPFVLIEPLLSGVNAVFLLIGTGVIFTLAFNWAFAPARVGDAKFKILPTVPKPVLVALWAAPWVMVLTVVFFAPQIEAATGVNMQIAAVLGLLGCGWLAVTVIMLSAAIANLRRVGRRQSDASEMTQ
jgi:hypothetical protein